MLLVFMFRSEYDKCIELLGFNIVRIRSPSIELVVLKLKLEISLRDFLQSEKLCHQNCMESGLSSKQSLYKLQLMEKTLSNKQVKYLEKHSSAQF